MLFLRRDTASPGSEMLKVVNMVSWLSVFSNAFLLCILQFWPARLPVEQELVGNNSIRCIGRRADWLSVFSIDF